jgi:hypothetical protein
VLVSLTGVFPHFTARLEEACFITSVPWQTFTCCGSRLGFQLSSGLSPSLQLCGSRLVFQLSSGLSPSLQLLAVLSFRYAWAGTCSHIPRLAISLDLTYMALSRFVKRIAPDRFWWIEFQLVLFAGYLSVSSRMPATIEMCISHIIAAENTPA